MTDDRLAHLHDVGRLLWPEPLRMSVGDEAAPSGELHREFLLLPNGRRPRLLVPRGRRAAVGALRGYGVGRGRSARWQAAGLTAAMAVGVAPLLLRDRVRLTGPGGSSVPVPSIEAHLAGVLGTEVLVSMYLGAPRANRKPVLQVLAPDGRTLGYVKVGIDALTCRLVRDEATALATLAAAGLRSTTVPTVLHSGRWNDLELLVLSPLPVGGRRRPEPAQVTAAQAEIAAIGATPAGPLSLSPYWAALTDRVEALPAGVTAETLAELTGRIGKTFGDVPVALGAWHGDWTPWNTARAGEDLLVWDWERFAPAVPVGFDALHGALQTDLVSHLADPARSAARSLSSAGSVLEPFGLSPEQARATSVCYLAELATRYLADRQVEAGARLGDVGAWLLPAIDTAVDSATEEIE
jgi:hypothetical protein